MGKDIKESFSSFHKKIESFFEERKKEANYPKAVLMFLIGIPLFTLFLRFINMDIAESNIVQIISENADYLIKNMMGTGLVMIILFLVSAGAYLFLSSKAFKIKLTFAQVLYFHGMALLAASAASFLFLLASISYKNTGISIITELISLIAIVGIFAVSYFILTMFRILTGISYKKTFVLMLAAYIIARNVAPFIFVFLVAVPAQLIGFNNPPTYYYYNITTNPDGSITATYAWMLNSTNKPREVCYVGFPKGWVERHSDLEAGKINYEFYKNISFNNLSGFEFVHAPQGWGRGFSRSALSMLKNKENKEWFYEVFMIETVNHGFQGDGTEFLDVVMVDAAKESSRHELDISSVSGFGFEAIYWAPYKEDSEIYYIINHSKCYKYGW